MREPRAHPPVNRILALNKELDTIAEIPKEEYILKCTSACAGCSDSLALRYMLKAAGPDTVLVVPACCTSVIQGIYPNTAFNIPVYNIAFGAAAACASGMSNTFRAAGKKTNVIVYAGDGGTLDIGIQSMSGAFEGVQISSTSVMTTRRTAIPACSGPAQRRSVRRQRRRPRERPISRRISMRSSQPTTRPTRQPLPQRTPKTFSRKSKKPSPSAARHSSMSSPRVLPAGVIPRKRASRLASLPSGQACGYSTSASTGS